ncbi:MAG: hypothetical protein F6K36_07425 [Symploca sp. SIO3C6]|uniref:Glutaredoxin n=1 Tax=Symploca sp. SIO1C4 TaxID=2607765 RepID=A0A6B3NCY8_9CYAN|nr:hypothetical protein [Symploca sp. SIO3C6]NER28472.1 hypothetical protein [Symploca sp. SIO1C4]NET04425.1 hypothetical protein [Symploca sp. SIO2B6]
MNITMVKKIKVNGYPCRKSANVLADLEKLGLMNQINQIVAADERQPSSHGLHLALQHEVKAAPFFIVENKDGSTNVYTAYTRFLKEVLEQQVSENEEVSEIMSQNPDLDFI